MVLDSYKPAIAAALATVAPKSALGIVESFATNLDVTSVNAKGGTILADMANSVAVAITGKSGLTKNLYEEMAAIGSGIVIGLQSGSHALNTTTSAATLESLIADITAQIVKVKPASAYEVSGAMLATANAFSLSVSDTLAAIQNSFNSIVGATAASSFVNATKAENALLNKIDNFNVGAITKHETAVVNL